MSHFQHQAGALFQSPCTQSSFHHQHTPLHFISFPVCSALSRRLAHSHSLFHISLFLSLFQSHLTLLFFNPVFFQLLSILLFCSAHFPSNIFSTLVFSRYLQFHSFFQVWLAVSISVIFHPLPVTFQSPASSSRHFHTLPSSLLKPFTLHPSCSLRLKSLPFLASSFYLIYSFLCPTYSFSFISCSLSSFLTRQP